MRLSTASGTIRGFSFFSFFLILNTAFAFIAHFKQNVRCEFLKIFFIMYFTLQVHPLSIYASVTQPVFSVGKRSDRLLLSNLFTFLHEFWAVIIQAHFFLSAFKSFAEMFYFYWSICNCLETEVTYFCWYLTAALKWRLCPLHWK